MQWRKKMMSMSVRHPIYCISKVLHALGKAIVNKINLQLKKQKYSFNNLVLKNANLLLFTLNHVWQSIHKHDAEHTQSKLLFSLQHRRDGCKMQPRTEGLHWKSVGRKQNAGWATRFNSDLQWVSQDSAPMWPDAWLQKFHWQQAECQQQRKKHKPYVQTETKGEVWHFWLVIQRVQAALSKIQRGCEKPLTANGSKEECFNEHVACKQRQFQSFMIR